MKKKNQYKMKTKHLITMMTILCLGLIVLSLSTSFSFAPVRNVLGYVIVPFQNGINEVGNWMTDQKNGFQSMKKLSAENEKLQKQVDELQAKNTTLSQDQEELDRLRTLYNLDTDYSEFEKVAAQVIGKDTGNWYSTFLINRGSSDGIAVDMNVIADGGLVGIVTETGAHWATVRSIIDDSSNVSATVTSISQNCMVTGDLQMMDDGKIRFIQLTGMAYCVISMVITRMVSAFGAEAIATQRVGGQIESISWNTADGFATALNAFIAQNYGAGEMGRVKKGYRASQWTVGIWGIFITLLFVCVPRPIANIFFHEPKAIATAVDYLIIVGFSEAFLCIETTTVGALSGLGRTHLCSVISIIFTSARIPLAIILGGTSLGLNGIWWALSSTSIVKGVLFVIVFQWVTRTKKQVAA